MALTIFLFTIRGRYLLPVPRVHPSLVRFLLAHERAVFGVAVPAFALEVIDAGRKVEPDDGILGAVLLRPLLGWIER